MLAEDNPAFKSGTFLDAVNHSKEVEYRADNHDNRIKDLKLIRHAWNKLAPLLQKHEISVREGKYPGYHFNALEAIENRILSIVETVARLKGEYKPT